MTLTEAIRAFEWPDGNIDCPGDEVIAAVKPFEDRIVTLEGRIRELEARCIAMVWLIPAETLAGDLQAAANRVRKILDLEAESK